MSTMWTSLALVPDDLLFFRDGKPSSRGADHYLRSLFPPHPSTLYGALRTYRLLDRSVELDGLDEAAWSHRLGSLVEELGPWGGFGSLALRGPWLVRDGEPLLPVPADLGVLQERGTTPRIAKVVRFRPVEPGAGEARPALGRLLYPFEADGSDWKPWEPPEPGVEPRPAQGWFLTTDGFAAWRRGGIPDPQHFVHASCLWHEEVRTGLELEPDKRLGKSGLIYTFGFIRLLSKVALGFEVAGTPLQAEGRVRLGGEGRTARLQNGPPFPSLGPHPLAPSPVRPPAPHPERERGKESGLDGGAPLPLGVEGGGRAGEGSGEGAFCLTFLTPTLSATGGYPPGFTATHPVGTLAGRPCRLIAAALPGSVTVGGWDLARKGPKPLRRAIPAGSVFVFEPVDGSGVEELLRDLDGTCLSDFSAESLARQGFGLAAAGISR